MSNVAIVREAAEKCVARASEKYGIDLSKTRISFNLRGRCAGMAQWRFDRRTGAVDHLELRFNVTMINDKGFDHVLNDTVPHEVAHIVCAVNPKLGRNHDAGWRRVCMELGGGGKRTHSEEVLYAKGRTYAYTTTNGAVITVSEQRHAKIQRGVTYNLRYGKGQVNRDCNHVLIAVSGRRVAETPEPVASVVAPRAPVTPKAAPVAAPKAAPRATGKTSKAEQIRDAIRRCKRLDLDRSIAIEFGVDELNMSRSQARKYVTENWDKA